MSFTPVTRCRACGDHGLFDVLDLGSQPLANAYRRPDDDGDEPRYPLALVCCPACSLVQLTGSVDPKIMFDDYQYFSSYATTMVDEMRRLAQRITADRGLTTDDLVVEVASNDGYLLKHYIDCGVRVLGVEPARNIAEVAEADGVPTVVEYFGKTTAEAIRADFGAAKVMHANNVMAHVPDINDFVAGFAALLAPDGVAYVESPYLGDFVAHCEFDTTYHEHVFYYSLTAVDTLVRRHGLQVSSLEHLSIHGGTLRYAITHQGGATDPSVARLLAREAAEGIATPTYYEGLQDHVDILKQQTLGLLRELKSQDATLAAYGAAAKGTVLLNHFGIGTEMVDFVVDRSPHKQGFLMPGVHIPIMAPDALLERRPTHVLLLAWNFADEIIDQQRTYRDTGGRFIVPIPQLRVV